MTIEVYETLPADFVPKMYTAACYLEVDGKVLLVQRAPHKSEPGKWGVPAGKLDPGETPGEAAVRELFEETGIRAQVRSLGALYMRLPKLSYVYSIFQVLLDHQPEVYLSDENTNYCWASNADLEKLVLMPGAPEGLAYFRSRAFPSLGQEK